jgi:DNA end-binding protein Ku
MKSMWTGMLGFGIVQIPVKLFTATENHDVGFHWHHGPKCLGNVGLVKTCKKCLKPVDPGDILSGTEVDGKVVFVSDEEKASLEAAQSKQIEILEFVGAGEIDPIEFENTYYVGTAEGEKAYALLAQSMGGLTALARFTMRGKTRRAALRAVVRDDRLVLILHTLRWPDEVRVPEVPGLGGDYSAAELRMAKKVVQSMVEKYDPNALVDTYQERLQELVAAKAEGAEFVVEPAVELDASDVKDVLAQLEASIRAHPAGRKKVAAKAPAKKAPAKAPVKRRKAVA